MESSKPRNHSKTIVLAVILGAVGFIGFSASAYVAYKNNETLHQTFDPAKTELNDYLNFITGKRVESGDTIQPIMIDAPRSSVAETDRPDPLVVSSITEASAGAEDEKKVLPTCSPYFKTDCVYDFEIQGSYYKQTLEDRILDLINEDRLHNGLKPLKYSGQAANHAYIHSKNMATSGIYEHSKQDLRTWKDYSGLVRRTCGENIWNLHDPFDPSILIVNGNSGNMDFETSVAKRPASSDFVSLDDIANWIHAGFMGSTGHRNNILNPMWTEGGIGIYIDTDNRNHLWVTEDLCR